MLPLKKNVKDGVPVIPLKKIKKRVGKIVKNTRDNVKKRTNGLKSYIKAATKKTLTLHLYVTLHENQELTEGTK